MSKINVSLSRRDVAVLVPGASTMAFLFMVIGGCEQATTPSAKESSRSASVAVAETATESRLPKLLDLGADKCIPCKMMAPILEELRDECAGELEVEFIDVWQDPDIAKQYGVQQIPTQIFFDASGNEVLRHTGFLSKEDILKTWKELGVDLDE